MKPLSIGISAAVLALSLAASTAVPAIAAPPGPNGPCAGPNCADRNFNFNNDNRGNFDRRGKFERRGNNAYFNNHRGFRERHAGYQYYNGFWFPPAAFVFGAIVGSAISNSHGHGYSAHVAWCESNYRSYRQWDNTWKPRNGPRQVCISPYG